MAGYELLFKKSAVKELEIIAERDRGRIIKVVQSLAEDPRPGKSEKLSSDDKFRLRQGDYRIVYSIDDLARKVVVFKVGHRRDVYR